MANILIIEDDPTIAKLMDRLVSNMGYTPYWAPLLLDGLSVANHINPDIVLLDLTLPDGNGLSILSDLMGLPSEPEVIIVTGTGDQHGAEVAFTNGAWDYIAKPFRQEDVRLSLARALQYHEEKMASKTACILRREDIVGTSAALMSSLELVAGAARTDASTLITGETGTGKELFARAIHVNSRRAKNKFVVVDCAALPDNLVESLLFGHVKGAFTGADRQQEGLIKSADGGTLFLDEVGELPLSIQKAFLRVLQEHRYRPVGSQTEISSDFRVISATNRNLDTMVENKEFRHDLLFRLQTFTMHLPPLRERKEDIKDIAIHYINQICETYQMEVKGYSPEFMSALLEYSWPGNVRELVNTIESTITLAGNNPTLHPKHLPVSFRISLLKKTHPNNQPAVKQTADVTDTTDELPSFKVYRNQKLSDIEEKYFQQLMRETQGDIKKACDRSGLSQSRLYTLLKEHGIATSVKSEK